WLFSLYLLCDRLRWMDQHEHVLDEAARLATNYRRTIRSRRVAPSPSEIKALDGLSGPLPELPSAAADVLALLDRVGAPATVATTGGRDYGVVNGGGRPGAA